MEPVFQKLTLGDTLTEMQCEQLEDIVREQPNVWALSVAGWSEPTWLFTRERLEMPAHLL